MSKSFGIEIRPVSAIADEAAYTAFLGQVPGAMLYYGLPYRRMLEGLLGCRGYYWMAWEDGKVVGILPTVEADGPHGKVVNSLAYFGSHGGTLATSECARTALREHYERQISAPGVLAATLIENLTVPEPIPPLHNLTDSRISQVTPLTGDGEAALIASIDGSARRNVRKAEASGVTVAVENDRLDFLYDTHVENMSVIGGRAKMAAFFDRLPEFFNPGTDFRVWVARREGRPVAALLLFYFGDTVEYFTPATVSSERENQPMAAILKHAMVEAGREGYRKWNWGGTWQSQNGVYRFKKKWGAVDGSYRYFCHVSEKAFYLSSSELLDMYPDFFVIPFDKLRCRS